MGDKLKQADGTLGEVRYVNTIQEARTMYNLEVEEAHTFFVGTQGWLVHNTDFDPDKPCDILASYSVNQGHHIIQAANVVPSKQRSGNAIVDAMLTVPDDVLAQLGVTHLGKQSLTSEQTRLARIFAKSGKTNTWAQQRSLAYRALVNSGLDPKIAKAWVYEAEKQMNQLMPNGPARTPYK